MKKTDLRLFIFAIAVATLAFTSSCKSKTKESDAPAATTSADTSTNAAPVIISGNEELKRGVTDATKDYPTIHAEVVDSVINLSGEIKRADWQKLNPTLNSLHPKRVNSADLTIK